MSLRSGVALLLLLAGCSRQAPAPEQANGSAPAAQAREAAGQVNRGHSGEPMPKAALTDVSGKPFALPSGKPVLVNLWATWCAPCIAEMPTLDRAAAQLGDKAAVLAVNQGDDAATVEAFLAAKPLAYARPLLDKAMAVSLGLNANLPTTILYDAAGRERWRVTGGRDWSSPASLKLISDAGT